MEWSDLLHNRLLICALISWGIAQVIKTIIYAVVNREINWSRLMGDGGMPSGHSATVTSLAVAAGVEYGLSSAIFAIAAILAIIVMHDAMGVRLEAGKHAKALNELLELLDRRDVTDEVKLKEFLGHTPSQVFFGAGLGVVVGLISSIYLV